MGAIRPPKPVKLFVGMLCGDRDLMARAEQFLTRIYGSVDISSGYWPFDATDYYRDELGEHVERHFISFESLISPENIADIKRETNQIEEQICDDTLRPHDRRPINLDPGYLSLSKIILATTKDYNHRIYLQRGIYAEVTLTFRDGRLQPFAWTYPDYSAEDYHPFFVEMRNRLKEQYAQMQPTNGGESQRA